MMWSILSQSAKPLTEPTRSMAHRLRQREADVLTDLYDHYGRIMFFVVLRMVESTQIAEALVEESFLRAWNRSREAPVDNNELGVWLIGISRACGKNYQQTRGLSCAHEEDYSSDLLSINRALSERFQARREVTPPPKHPFLEMLSLSR